VQPASDILRIGENHLLGQTMLRLVLAALLGGAVGLQRELWHKAAGLRTQKDPAFTSIKSRQVEGK